MDAERDIDGTAHRERNAAWWAGWWAADFSWDGLAGKDWLGWSVTPDGRLVETGSAPDGARGASLQDYFRRDGQSETLRSDAALIALGLLERAPARTLISRLLRRDTPGHRLFHILHLPPRWQDGRASWKADPAAGKRWAPLEAELARQLAAARETEFDELERPVGADRRAQLDGCVIRTLPLPAEIGADALHLRARHLHVRGDLNLTAAIFGPQADFSGARFDGIAVFEGAQFNGEDIYFEAVSFNGEANFRDAHFNENAWFSRTVFAGITLFDNAKIGGLADFARTRFTDDTSFRAISVDDDADFMGARFNVDTDFRDAKFNAGAGFLDINFNAEANFQGASFNATTSFCDSHLDGVDGFKGDADFRGAIFNGETCFLGLSFNARADFQDARFNAETYFTGLHFSGVANFKGATFNS
ncbi:pentapeptide repeat-containing protein [uncultured Maricaulis sp.]|uniref:pentapeptide repeat-containing protein n=1 Tax=uncultured Maricaulis sp. TaxID=174710 RepID=UPI0030DB478A|tara:strand:+ start:38954 stop:40210 length:1257 start_codon:yes stop_codon:yes gene_type:complete